jgi:isopentenyl-diphosphate Delta-isomerase
MEYKKITVVDDNDQLIGFVSYDEAIERNLIRRASVVFIFNERGEILVQKRSKNISKPLQLDKSCAGHVDEGETYYETAIRELREELGLENCELKEIRSSYRNEMFFDTIYKTTIASDMQLHPDPHEVDSVFWYLPEELSVAMAEQSDLFTSNFISIWAELRDTIVQA